MIEGVVYCYYYYYYYYLLVLIIIIIVIIIIIIIAIIIIIIIIMDKHNVWVAEASNTGPRASERADGSAACGAAAETAIIKLIIILIH